MSALASEPLASLQRGSTFVLLALVLVCGIAVTLLEFAAVRLLAPFFGQSPTVWTNVIAVVLLALAAGAWLGGRIATICAAPHLFAWLPAAAGTWVAAAATFGARFARLLMPDGFRDGPDPSLALVASLEASLVLFAPPLVALGAIAPLVLERRAAAGRRGLSAGTVLAWSTLGSVVGAYASNLALVPWIGTRRTLFVCAALLFSATILALRAVPTARAARVRSGIAAGLLLACACGATVDAGPQKGPGIAGDRVLFERDSALQTVRVLERDGFDRTTGTDVRTRVLALDEGDVEFHSARILGRLDSGGRYFDTLALLPLLVDPPADGTFDVLVVGFAAGTLYAELDALLGPSLRCVGVEIDSVVLDAAERWFDLRRDDPRLTLLVGDGRFVVNTLQDDARFDLIVVDAYARQTYIPFQVATRECFEALHAHLEPTGLLALNVDCRKPAARLLSCLSATIEAAHFGPVWFAPVRDYPSAILFCGRDDETPLRLVGQPPRFLENAARAFSALLVRPRRVATDLVFTDDHAPVEHVMHAQLDGGESGHDDPRACDMMFDEAADGAASATMDVWREAQTLRFAGDSFGAIASLEAFAREASWRDASWADNLAAEIEARDLANAPAALARSRASAGRIERAALEDATLADLATHARALADWYETHASERTRASERHRSAIRLLLATLATMALATMALASAVLKGRE